MTVPTLPTDQITSDYTVVEITAAFTAYTGTTATADITGMTNLQITALNNAKIATGGITGEITGFDALAVAALVTKAADIAANTLTGSSVAMTDAQFVVLGSKLADGVTVTIDAALATLPEIAAMTLDAANISTLGITGAGTAVMTATQFTALGSKLANAVVDASVNATGATATQIAAIVTDADNIKVAGITGTGLSVTDTQFLTLSPTFATSKLATSVVDVSVNATDATAGEVAAMVGSVAHIKALGVTGTGLAMTDSQFMILAANNKLALAVTDVTVDATDAQAVELLAMAQGTNPARIGSITGTGITSAAPMSDTQFLALGSKLADSVTVRVDASVASPAEIAAMVTDVANISALGITGTLISMTATQFTALGSKLANAVVDVSVNATSATAPEIAAMVTDAANIKAFGITGVGITTAAPMTDTQFLALAPKLATSVVDIRVDADAASAPEIAAMVANAARIGALGVTGTGLALTDTEFAVLGSKLANAVVDVTVNAAAATLPEIAAMALDAANIGALGITGAGTAVMTAPQFAALGSKLADAVVDASVNATGATAGEVDAMVTDKTNIKDVGITGTGIAMTDTQFTALAAKLATTATANINASAATADEITAMVTGVAKIGALGITGTGINSVATMTDTQFTTLAPKFALSVNDVKVDASGAIATEITAMVANAGRIGALGITGTGLALTDTQFLALGSKLANAVVDVTVDAALATAPEIAAMALDAGNIGAITGAGTAVMTAPQFAALGSKLADAVVDASVNATGATAPEITAIVTDAANIKAGGITGTGIALTDTQFVTLVPKLATTVVDVRIDASAATAEQITSMVTNVARIGALGVTGTGITSVAPMTDTQFAVLAPKLALSVTDVAVDASAATAPEIAAMVTNAARIGALGVTGTGITSVAPMTDTQFAVLGSKLADGVTVRVDASAAIAPEIAAMVTDVANIGALSITGTGIAMSDTQFAVLGSKLADAVLDVSVNATGATVPEVAAMVTDVGNIKVAGITGTGIAMTDTQFVLLAPKLALTVTDVAVDASAATAPEILAMVTGAARIGALGVTGAGTAIMTDSQFAALGSKFAHTVVDVRVDASAASPTEIAAMVLDAANIGALGVTGSGIAAMTDTQFTALGSKLADGVLVASVDAALANPEEIAAMTLDATNITAITGAGTAIMTDTQFLALGAKFATPVVDVRVDASAASPTEIAGMVTNVARIGAFGITGTGIEMTGTQFGTLGSKLADSVVDVTVDATGMAAGGVAALLTDLTNIAHIDGVLPLSRAQNLAQLNSLFAKDDAVANDIVDATGMPVTSLNALATNASKIGSITGDLRLTSAFSAATSTALQAKVTGETASAFISGMDATRITALDNTKIATGGIVGSVTGFAPATLTALATKAIDIAPNSLAGTLAITSVVAEADIGTLLGKMGAGAIINVAAGSMTPGQLDAVAAPANIPKVTAISGVMALTNAQTVPALHELFAKSTGTANTVDATHMGVDKLHELALRDATTPFASVNLQKIGSAKITGEMELRNALSLTELTDLFSKDDAVANDLVHASNMNFDQLNLVASKIAKIATDGISGEMALDFHQSALQLTALFGKEATIEDDIVNATDMTAAAFDVVITNLGKVHDITGVLTLGNGLAGTDGAGLAALFAKETFASELNANANDIVDATSMNAAAIDVLATNANKIAHIDGELALTDAQDDVALTALFERDDAAQNDTVDLGTMNPAAFALVAENVSKIASITGDMALANDTPHLADLLAVYTGTSASVDATDMIPTTIDMLVENAGKITTATGITGSMHLTSNQDATGLATLFGKTAGTTNTVNATGMDSNAMTEVLTHVGLVASIDGAMTLTDAQKGDADGAGLTALFGKDDGGANDIVDVTGMNPAAITIVAANIDKIASVIGTLPEITAAGMHDIGILLPKYTGDITVDATGMLTADLVIISGIEALAEGSISHMTLDLGNVAITDGIAANLLAKATDAIVTATGATFVPADTAPEAPPSKMDSLVANIANVKAIDGITGDLCVNAASLDLLGKYDGATAVLDATGMLGVDVLSASSDTNAAFNPKIVSITGAMELDSTVSDPADLIDLFSKDDAEANDVVDATGMISDRLDVLVDNASKIANITGALPLTVAQSAEGIAALLDIYTGNSAAIVATGATAVQLASVAQYANKIADHGISGVMALTADLTGADLAALFSKDDAVDNDTFVAGMYVNPDTIDAIALGASHIAADGITGEFTVGGMNNATALTDLFGKINGTATVIVDATHMNPAELTAVGVAIDKVDTLAMNGSHRVNVTAADIDGNTLTILGGGINVNGTGDADVIDLTNVGGKAGTHIVGGAGADDITLNATTSDVVVLASASLAVDADRITGFHAGVVNRDKISVDVPAHGAGVTAGFQGNVNVNGTGADVVLHKGITAVASSLTTALTLDAAGIYGAITGGTHDLVFGGVDNVVYIAIDDGTDTAIARLDATAGTTHNTVIHEDQITVIGILPDVADIATLSAGNFVGF